MEFYHRKIIENMRSVFTLLFAIFSINVYCQSISPKDSLELLFEETFTNDSLLKSNWDYKYPWGRTLWSAKHVELQWYSNNNVTIENNTLYLTAKQDTTQNQIVSWWPIDTVLGDGFSNNRAFYYTSGIIYSKQTYGYGYYEINCKMPKGYGFWPCFWIWAPQGEIDICEPSGNLSETANSYGATFHYPGGASGSTTKLNFDFSESFNTYSVLWLPNKITWFCNDSIVKAVTDSLVPSCKMSIIANLAVDPFYKPKPTTTFPQAFEIRYIRYYGLKAE